MYIVQIWCVHHNAFFSPSSFQPVFWKRCQNVCYAQLWFSEFLMSTEKVVHFNKAWTKSTQSHWVSYLYHETFEKHMWLDFNSLTYRNMPQNALSLLDYTLQLSLIVTSFYGKNQKIETKKHISKISVDSNFTFSSYAWLSGGGGALECQGGYQARPKNHIIRVVFQDQALYAHSV